METGPQPLRKLRAWEQVHSRQMAGDRDPARRCSSTKGQGNMRGSWGMGGVNHICLRSSRACRQLSLRSSKHEVSAAGRTGSPRQGSRFMLFTCQIEKKANTWMEGHKTEAQVQGYKVGTWLGN